MIKVCKFVDFTTIVKFMIFHVRALNATFDARAVNLTMCIYFNRLIISTVFAFIKKFHSTSIDSFSQVPSPLSFSSLFCMASALGASQSTRNFGPFDVAYFE